MQIIERINDRIQMDTDNGEANFSSALITSVFEDVAKPGDDWFVDNVEQNRNTIKATMQGDKMPWEAEEKLAKIFGALGLQFECF